MPLNLPTQGFTFWPIGTGDSTTVRVSEDVFLQIDIRHMSKSEDDEDPAWPIIDHLEEILPLIDEKPYLSTFALSHPDQDHCQGFEDLLERVHIGELWLSPRTFREFKENEELCEDAIAFHNEALRRVDATIDAGGDPGSGNRVRIIGYDYLLKEEEYQGFPEEYFSIPGHAITILDGYDYNETFRAFIHAPFLDDSYGDRNDCSLAFQISLWNQGEVSKLLVLGDLKYPILRRIFTVSDEVDLQWNVLLAPHHCSKSAMYWKDDEEGDELLKQDILNDLASSAMSPGFIISSSSPIPSTNKSGDNPPHAIAKRQYLRIVPNEFICTHEHPDPENPAPILFAATSDGLDYLGTAAASEASLEDSINSAQGSNEPPVAAVGFGYDFK